MQDTKIVVVERGVYEPNQEAIFWEPLSDQGLVAREQNVFENYDTPIPQTAEEAIEDTSTHEFDDLTQVYSVTFVGRQLLFCPHPEEVVEERSLIQRALDRWRDMPERERRAVFEGPFDRIWSRGIDRNDYDFTGVDWALPQSYMESPAYFREVQRTTRAQDLQVTIRARPIPELAEAMRRIQEAIAASMMIPTSYWSPLPSNGAYYPYACHPSRSHILDEFYSRMTPMQIENLKVEL